MLRILDEQMRHLGAATRRRFVGRMHAYLRAEFPVWVLRIPDDALRGWLEGCVAAAERHGVTTEPEVAQLILLFMVLDEDEELRTPWVRETLEARRLAPIGKVKKLISLARERGVAGLEHVVLVPGMAG